MKQRIFVTSLATVTACIVLGFFFSRFVLPVSAENGTTETKSAGNYDISSDYLTPQQFKQEGDKDDTESFRRMFAAAYAAYNDIDYPENSPAVPWRRCKPIYIPSGKYRISGSIVDEDLTTDGGHKVRNAMFEVFGAGRESTIIQFIGNGETLFNDHITSSSDTSVIFAFSTFRDIGFDGKGADESQKNTFMYLASSNKNSNGVSTNGAQRLQFLSCGFSHFKKILECAEGASQMLSEITFSYCRINDCGKRDPNNTSHVLEPCDLFTLTCPQGVNWRFDYTDIESIYGNVFHFKGAGSVMLNGGSVVVKSGDLKAETVSAFNFDYADGSGHGSDSGNAPQVFCNGTRFEIWENASLLKVKNNCKSFPAVTFRSCNLNATTVSDDNLLVINGGVDALFEDCFGCSTIAISGQVPTSPMVLPTITFRDCSDLNVDNLVAKSSVKGTLETGNYNNTNNVRIIVDDSYDFYLYNQGYVHTVTKLNECRQQVNLSGKDGYDLFNLENDKTFEAKPYGFVKYVEVTVPKQNISGEATLRLYETAGETRKQIGEDIKIMFDSSRTHMIVINDYIENLEAVFTWPYSKKGASMNMTIVKY
ncbi:MAG: hypothetical protein IK081_10035 [Lachnospiraceae bacterium]|nr:hypothetical protein [Lachnospiraceae bacterium]